MSGESITTSESPLAALRYAAGTDIGRRREENQDAHGVIETALLRAFFVCDGMGGVQGGAIASNLAVATIGDLLKDRRTITAGDIAAAISQANANIFERGSREPGLSGMGTTCVGLVFVDERMFIANVGDSRAYRIRDGEVVQLTEDHTLVRELVRSGALAPELAENHPVSHMLTRSLGPTPTTEVDCLLAPDGPRRGDRYLLCCDGLYNMVGDDEFTEILEHFPLEDAVQEFIDLANARGGTDNITLIIIEVGPDYPVEPAYPANEGRNGVDSGAVTSARGVTALPTEPPYNGSTGLERPALDGDEGGRHGSSEESLHADEEDGFSTGERAFAAESAAPAPDTEPVEIEAPSGEPPAQPSHERERSNPAPTERNSDWLGTAAAFFGVLIVGFGIGYMYSHVGDGGEEMVAVVAPSTDRGAIAPSETPTPVSRTAIPTPPPVERVVAGPARTDDAATQGDKVQQRREQLRRLVRSLDDKIASFDQPMSGRLGETLSSTTKTLAALNSDLEAVRTDIDLATRKLAVWYGRRKKLKETDPVNLASEVAIISPEVKQRKESFEQATWAYLKEAEALRYDPADQSLADRVAELGRVRSEKLSDLVVAVRSTIESEVEHADRHIFELTLRRDETAAEIDAARRELEYLRILLGADEKQRAAKKAELVRERSSAVAELARLEAVLPVLEP